MAILICTVRKHPVRHQKINTRIKALAFQVADPIRLPARHFIPWALQGVKTGINSLKQCWEWPLPPKYIYIVSYLTGKTLAPADSKYFT